MTDGSAGAVTVRFWGVRGTMAAPGNATLRYGGNTACVELRCGEHLIILDAGTGLRPLGDALAQAGGPVTADLFCSHTHYDHICGLSTFAPLYQAGNEVRVWAGHLPPPGSIGEVFRTILSAPLLPDLMTFFQANVRFTDFTAGEALAPRPGIAVCTAPLNHPGGSTGYRFEACGKVVAYVTDTEHQPGELDGNVLRLVERADIMIYDATYTEAEFAAHIGWGHSTWEEAVRLAQAAAVKRLVLFHHDARRDDVAMDAVAAAAAAACPGTLAAREGMILTA